MERAGGLKILFVVNPNSGKKKKTDWESFIRNYFKGLPHTIEFFILSGKDDTVSLQYWIKKFDFQRIVAVGGDGTVSLVAKQLLGSESIIGILPAGSANGMATELDIPEDATEALDVIVNGRVKKCDVIKINETDICMHLSDFGLNARLIKYFEESPLRGKWGYARMIFKVLWRKTLMTAEIVTDNAHININAYLVVIANARKYGTDVAINPEGNISDGLFEIVVVRQISFLRLLKMFISYKYFHPKHLEVYQTKKATITTKRKTHFQVDGEYKGKIDLVKAEIIPGQLNILIKK